jgi:CDP-4-dehydro-6-deoxyglucose reductase
MYEQARQWAGQNKHIQFTSALQEPGSEDPADSFTGFVHEAVLQHYGELSNFDIYMSGPPAMIDAGRSAFLENGAVQRRIFFDSFEFGLDVPIRVLAKPH